MGRRMRRKGVFVSRLRLRLAGGFALAFTVGLALMAAAGLGYLWRESTRRFDEHLAAVTVGLIVALDRELHETPDSSAQYVAGEVAAEWPDNGDAFLVVDDRGAIIARHGDGDSASANLLVTMSDGAAHRATVDRDGADMRARMLDTTMQAVVAGTVRRIPMRIIAFGSTEGIESDTELLAVVLAVSAPIILLASLAAGYLLAGRALQPIRELSADISGVAPSDLSRRVARGDRTDEVGLLATEFDGLLARLEEAQHRNRQFVRETAHQIRTPLTLVLGEAGHALERADGRVSDAELRATLARIRTAAEQMRRRVDELFLLAEARSGEVVRLEELVELDELVLECTDLMRARASATGHSLAIDRADPVTVLGNSSLLQEALLELLENACRHGARTSPIAVSCTVDGEGHATLEVASDGDGFGATMGQGRRASLEAAGRDASVPAAADGGPRMDGGIGLSIVQWVVQSHRGQVEVTRDGRRNLIRLLLPRHAPPAIE